MVSVSRMNEELVLVGKFQTFKLGLRQSFD